MAPEVGLRKPYNLKADVYSWSMLMWYILELEPPLGMYTPKMFRDRVFKKGTRPAVMDHWPKSIPNLLKKCWSANIDIRPSFAEIKVILGAELLPYNDRKLIPEDVFVESSLEEGHKLKSSIDRTSNSTELSCQAC